MSFNIFSIPFSDNYIWALVCDMSCVIVDPGQAQPVIDFLEMKRLNLDAILVTHHHFDHIEGVLPLKAKYPNVNVYGPRGDQIEGLDKHVSEGDRFILTEIKQEISVLETPGHTLDHLTYVCNGHIFCGDTLFSAGCGRLFEGTPAQMYLSFQKLLAFPDKSLLYGGHEYTLSNIAFARHIEPDNLILKQEEARIKALCESNTPSLPTSIALEKKINPFVRVNEADIKAIAERKAGKLLEKPEDVFAILRVWKDSF